MSRFLSNCKSAQQQIDNTIQYDLIRYTHPFLPALDHSIRPVPTTASR